MTPASLFTDRLISKLRLYRGFNYTHLREEILLQVETEMWRGNWDLTFEFGDPRYDIRLIQETEYDQHFASVTPRWEDQYALVDGYYIFPAQPGTYPPLTPTTVESVTIVTEQKSPEEYTRAERIEAIKKVFPMLYVPEWYSRNYAGLVDWIVSYGAEYVLTRGWDRMMQDDNYYRFNDVFLIAASDGKPRFVEGRYGTEPVCPHHMKGNKWYGEAKRLFYIDLIKYYTTYVKAV